MIYKQFDNIDLFISGSSDGNMSLVQDNSQKTINNRVRFIAKCGIKQSSLFEGVQTHSTNIKRITAKSFKIPQRVFQYTDALMSDVKGAYLMIKTADCIPILLYHQNPPVIALIHAGWKGLDAGFISQAMTKLCQDYKLNPSKIRAYLGPHIKKCCYVYSKFPWARADKWQSYIKHTKNTASCDLTSFALNALQQDKIKATNILVDRHCTACSPELFSHYRSKKNKSKSNRFAIIAGIKDT